MEFEFVCHASIILRRDPVHLISDPWLTGTSFDDGWALLSEPVFRPEDFATVTHIWISHEHPDHFSPRSLAMIPEAIRARIELLFHASSDRKVVDHCAKLGFAAVRELEHGRWYALAPDFEIRCDSWESSDDSWLLVRTPECSVLNLNDCQANTPAQLQALHAQTGDVDVLLTQYSISAWDGNEEDIQRREAGAQSMLDRAVMQASTLKARYVIPFASYIWFCHEENAYMNSALRAPGDVAALISEQTEAQPVVLYPGDRWVAGVEFDSARAIARYAEDIASIPSRPLIAAEPVDVADLVEAAERFRAEISRGRSPLRMRLGAVKSNVLHQQRMYASKPLTGRIAALRELFLFRTRPKRLWLNDHEQCVEFCLQHGLRLTSREREDCDMELSSGALLFAFRFLWGGETLFINGRFREMYPGGHVPMFRHFGMAGTTNRREGAKARPL